MTNNVSKFEYGLVNVLYIGSAIFMQGQMGHLSWAHPKLGPTDNRQIKLNVHINKFWKIKLWPIYVTGFKNAGTIINIKLIIY